MATGKKARKIERESDKDNTKIKTEQEIYKQHERTIIIILRIVITTLRTLIIRRRNIIIQKRNITNQTY